MLKGAQSFPDILTISRDPIFQIHNLLAVGAVEPLSDDPVLACMSIYSWPHGCDRS